MQSGLWNYFSGYVIISVKGFSWEKFVNKASSAGISILDITCLPDRTEMKIPLRDCSKLKLCALKSGCSVKILEGHGVPFIFRSLRKKGFFMWGLFIFLCLLFVLSSFIWEVRIVGAYRIPKEDILSFAAEQGLSLGASKKSIATDSIEKSFLLHFDEISWISIDIKGTRAEITLAEALETAPSPIKGVPSNIVAKKAGVIDKIYAASGTPVVSPGDTVLAGDLLISGTPIIHIDGEPVSGEPVCAGGKVFARNTYSLSISIPKIHKASVPTGKTQNIYTLILPNKEITLSAVKGKGLPYDITSSKERLLSLGDFSFPLGIRRQSLSFYEEITLAYTENEAHSILTHRLLYKLSALERDTKILNLTYGFSESHHSFCLEATFTVSESIGKEENF